MSEPRMAALSDQQVDRLIGRLDDAAPTMDPFATDLLTVLESRVRVARRQDASPIGRWVSAGSAAVARASRATGTSPRIWQVAAMLAVLLLAGAVAFVGMQRHRLPASQLGFHRTPQEDLTFAPNRSVATLLADGRVLIVRGSVEIFDPQTGAYDTLVSDQDESAASFQLVRSAFQLADGDVLVFGSSAVILDPGSGSFERLPSLPEGYGPTSIHPHETATRLLDGRILLAGGEYATTEGGVAFAPGLIFDPATRSFSKTGAMLEGRYRHTATLLRDGRVLIAGGATDGADVRALASAEIFDPTTGRFSPGAPMPEPRSDATATLLADGRVLVVGGGPAAPCPPIATALLYDPATDSWARTGWLHTGRFAPSSIALNDGRVLVMGGRSDACVSPDGNPAPATATEAELYDPDIGTFSPTGSAAIPRLNASLVLLPDGEVFVSSDLNSIRTGAGPDELFGPLP